MGISIWQLLVVLLIVALVFGTKKLRSMGGDLGSAVKSFRSAIKETEKEVIEESPNEPGNIIDGEVESEKDASQKV